MFNLFPFLKGNHSNNKSYSQSGEDLIVNYLVNWLKIKEFGFLDIGAFDPVKINNTYLFYLMGFRGVNVDGNIEGISRFNRIRPKDINICKLVSSFSEEVKYYEFDAPTLNTIDESFAEEIIKEGKYNLVSEKKVEAIGINDLIKRYFINNLSFSFLSLDVEGFDLKILSALDFDLISPSIICVETIEFKEIGLGEKDQNIIYLLKDKGYFHYADTYINSIFVRKNLF